jgi:hypothetical protein
MNLTEKEQEAWLNIRKYAALRHYIANGIKSTKSVERLLKYQIIPVKASTQRMCNNENHCSQFHYLSEMLLNTYAHTITWANRGGSKTYFLALINWLKSLILPNRECVILGASKEQSLRAYNAMSTFWDIGSYDGFDKPLESDYLDGESLKEHTKYKNKSEVYILAASQKSVSGPHPQSLNLDEVDEMDSDVLEQALSQPQEKYDIPSQLTMSSTNHVAFGNMEMHLERASANENSKIFQWCVWETLEACTDYRCSTCPLLDFCPGKQMKNATGYYKIKDFLTKLETLSMFTVQVQWFCNKIGAPDLVYRDEFDPDLHILRNINFNPSKSVHLSIDWGGTHPFALGVYQDYTDTKLNAWVKVDEIYESNTDNQHIIKIAKQRPWWNYIHASGMICDPSRSDLRREWAAKGVGVRTKGANNSVDIGLSKVKGALKPVIGRPKIYFSNKCQHTIREFSAYKLNKKGKPIQENDHAMDELRYFIIEKVNPIQKKSDNKPIVSKSNMYEKMNF